MRRFSFSLAGAALAATLAGCGSVMTSPPSGFLSRYDAPVSAPWAIDPAQVTLAEVAWRVAPRPDLDEADRRALADRLAAELRRGVGTLPPAPHGRAVVLRAAITRVEPVSPALNTASALLLLVPLDRGGAAVEIEAVDAQTGRQLAALSTGSFAPLSDLRARFSKLGPAEIVLAQAAADFTQRLRAP